MRYAFDPYSDDFKTDPYAIYDELRAREPISFQEPWNLTFFSRHRDVHALLRDRRLGRDIVEALGTDQPEHRELPADFPAWSHYVRRMAFLDREGEFHSRLRSLLARAFTKRRVEGLRPMLELTADSLLDEAAQQGGLEVMSQYATPIPLTTISALLDVPDADVPKLIPWSHALVGLYELSATPEMGAAAEQATNEFVEFIQHLIDQRRYEPGDDLLSALAFTEEDGVGLTEDEIIGTAILLLNAGHEATVHAIGNAMLALLNHPQQLEFLRDRPDMLPIAVDELLRFDTPLQMFERWVLEDFEIDGVRLETRTKIGFLMGAANHDPDAFSAPRNLDLSRADNPHVSFGGGAHYCLGAPLGRLEMEVAIGTLLRRFPSIEQATEAVRRDSFIFRGIDELQLSVGGT